MRKLKGSFGDLIDAKDAALADEQPARQQAGVSAAAFADEMVDKLGWKLLAMCKARGGAANGTLTWPEINAAIDEIDAEIEAHRTALATAPPPVDANVNSQIMVALEESIKLQSHYAGILNNFDGGKRIQFSNAAEWITRMKEIGKLATAPPEQASQKQPCDCKQLCERLSNPLPPGRFCMADAAQEKMRAEPPQAGWQPPPASDGALIDAEFFLKHETTYTQKPSGRYEWRCSCGDSSEDFATWTDCHRQTRKHWAYYLNAALAAHDQKVRAEVCEQRITLEQVRNLPKAERPISVVIGFHDGHIVKAEGEGALEFYRAMLDGRKRAEEERVKTASGAEEKK